jgi:hypothetical protein
MQQDPIMSPGDLQDANRYVYAGDSPIDFTDPSGLSFLDDVGDALRDADDWVSDKLDTVNEYVVKPARSIWRRTPRPVQRCAVGAALIGGATRSWQGAGAGCALGIVTTRVKLR